MTSFNPESEPGFFSRSDKSIEEDRKAEKAQKKRQYAIEFIVGSGRAKSPEEAEAYLLKMNSVKEKLLNFIKIEVPRLQEAERAHYTITHYDVNYFDQNKFEGREPADPSMIQRWPDEDFDRANPHLWSLTRKVGSVSGVTRFTEDLLVEMADGKAVSIPGSTEEMAWQLNQYFQPEEIDFLISEYKLEKQALIDNLQKQVDSLKKKRQDQTFDWRLWEPLAFSKEEKGDEAS